MIGVEKKAIEMSVSDDSTDHGGQEFLSDATRLVSEPTTQRPMANSRASLIVLSGWEIGHEIPIRQCPQVIGRSVSADMHINSPSVSRRHAQIDLASDGDEEYFTLTDLNSSNGTHVNNIPAKGTRLQNGDRIRMGDVLFKFVLQDEIDMHFHQQVHRLIHYDQLTGLMTMDAFRGRLDTIIHRRDRSRPLSLAMTDLDGLKKVNDTYGHLAGRMIVREMGEMMRQCLRRDDLAALYGGDEAVILYVDTPLDEACTVAEKIRVTIAERVFEHQGHTFQVSISQGLAEWPRHGKTPEALIAAADQALYAAKNAGRNCVRRAQP